VHIARGQLVAYPTEAVYGIGCDPRNLDAIGKVLELKARSANKGFILIASELSQLADFIEPPTESELATLNKAWPGPATFVVRAKSDLPPILTGNRDTLAVRVSAHPVVVELCNACSSALISTSANLSGTPALTSQDDVVTVLGEAIAGVVAGDLGTLQSATPIVSLITGEQLR